MLDAGPVFDELLDRLHDMACPSVCWGRVTGSHDVYIECVLPVGATEHVGETLEQVARAIIDLHLTCPDRDRQAEEAKLA